MLSEEQFKKVIRKYITWINITGKVEDFYNITVDAEELWNRIKDYRI